MEHETEYIGPGRHRGSNLSLLIHKFVQFQILSDSFQIDFRASNFLPHKMLETVLLWCSAKLAGQFEHIFHQRTPAYVRIADLRVFAMLGAQHFEALAIGVAGWIVEITKHRIALESRFEDAAKTGLAFIFVEAFFHVTNGGARMNFMAASDAVHGHFILFGVVQGLWIENTMSGTFDQQIQFLLSLIQFTQCRSYGGLLCSIHFQLLDVSFFAFAWR